jgi:hypothetical protein
MIPKNKIPFILRHVQLTSNYSLFLSLDVHHEIREVSFKQLAETECGKPYDLVSSAFEVNSLYPALLRWDMPRESKRWKILVSLALFVSPK